MASRLSPITACQMSMIQEVLRHHHRRCTGQQPAHANAFQDLVVSRVRPELEKDEAIVMLMDAKSTLTELSVRHISEYEQLREAMRQQQGCI